MRGGFAGQAPVLWHELRYGSREFHAASDLARRFPHSPRIPALMGSAVRDPALIRAFVAIWRLPNVDLRVRQADFDAWREFHFGPARRGRLAQAVLELPTAEEKYLSGRHKQALRTNLRHARKLGVTSDRVLTHYAWFEAASVIQQNRHDGKPVGREMDKPEPGQQVAYYVSRDVDEIPLDLYPGTAARPPGRAPSARKRSRLIARSDSAANPVLNRAEFICSRCETDAPIPGSACRADPAPDSLVADEAAKRQ